MSDPAVLIFLGVAISSVLASIGSSVGSAIVARVGSGLLAKDPSKFPQVLIFAALPSSQSLYGFLYGVILLLRSGLINGKLLNGVTTEVATQFMVSALPVGLACLFSAIYQGIVGAGSLQIVSKNPENTNQGIVITALIESFAIFGLIISILIGFVAIKF